MSLPSPPVCFLFATFFFILLHLFFPIIHAQYSSTNTTNSTTASNTTKSPAASNATNSTAVLTTTGSSNSSSLVTGVSIGGTVAGIVVIAGVIIWWKRRKRRLQLANTNRRLTPELSMLEKDAEFAHGPRRFTYKQLSAATKTFSEKELLGRGGFGPVYKGILPGYKNPVAVKCISQNSKQGEREFVAEVTIISRIRHRNLVQLQGWCHDRGELLLVYDYMPNGSLDRFLFGNEEDGLLDWNRRYQIVLGLAAAILYLHEEWEEQVIHRDIKASNVLLDEGFNARLGDFGLARLVQHERLLKTTIIAGTPGYIAPECIETLKATTESDVFSFGAVALEVACGRRPIDISLETDSVRLVDWVWGLHGQGRLLDAADSRLAGVFDPDQMNRLLILGLACSHPDPSSRPTIRQAHACLMGQASPPTIPKAKPVAFYGNAPPPKGILEILSEKYSSELVTSSSIDSQVLSSSMRRPLMLDVA